MPEPLSKVPDVVEHLTALWKTAAASLPDEVEVFDGFREGPDVPARAVVVGVPWETRASYTSTVEVQQGMRGRLEETWTVTCMASVLLLGTDRNATPTARRAVGDLLGVLADAVRTDRHPAGDPWQLARVEGDLQWMPVLTGDGMACSVVFSVSGKSLL